ncbi:uncharacterized protein LOC131289056 [Anopheles ziemanni]|uniref:uncharacterized protein LOC131271850 n=1 Tax=Anopheles coustani TaxID=139045 RepID=UPI00265ACA8F|nr:uncharacterized protein LOC131271850 [Anopheles coustani]XP_058174239.1 uncharacterized protein LOC131289056 [Anopheles ziemanni]
MKLLLERGLLLLGLLVLGTLEQELTSRSNGEAAQILTEPRTDRSRSKRTLVYTFNSCSGILIAMSIPLLVTGRNIFVSYNFEANYNMPTDSTDFTQGILKKGDNEQIEGGTARKVGRSITTPTTTTTTVASPRGRSSFSRKKFYRTIDVNLQRYGFAGKRCILRMICDLAQTPLQHENGVLGDLLQLIFTPSMSRDENLPVEFYRAEELGRNDRNCSKYRVHCPSNPIDLVSFVL